ncbi:MAG: ferrous iron transport protein B [Polyangiaceae bacterium]
MTQAAREAEGDAAPDSAPAARHIVILGNPNVGKTTLFNALTGQRARVGNYPGVTVERREGRVRLDAERSVDAVDVPGAYSLSARSAEEQIAISSVLGLDDYPEPALVVLVVDAGQLIRNLYLALQLAELGVPFVIALNMIDEVADSPPSAEAVGKLFGVPCVATDSRRRKGLEELRQCLGDALATPPRPRVHVAYSPELIQAADRIAAALPDPWRGSVERDRALALWALTSVDEDDELADFPAGLREACLELQAKADAADLDRDVIASRYRFLDDNAHSLYATAPPEQRKRPSSERVDRVLLHPVFGFAIFTAVMLLLFQALFSWADPAISVVEESFGALGKLLSATLPPGILTDLLVEGVVGGVGNVVVFLPQILLLFLFIGILEDSGYMARVAYLMDRIMRSLGLHGRAFVPMLSGFACAVPAIMATRTMERFRDRLLTMLVIPLMTCSARLPVYTLIIAALFPPRTIAGFLPVQGLLMVAMYLFSVLIALASAAVLGRTVVKGRSVPLLLELPPYRLPGARAVVRQMWDRALVFLKEAGSVILVATIVLWALLSFPKVDAPRDTSTVAEPVPAQSEAEQRSFALQHSYGGKLGKALEPALEPLGFDWKIGVGIIGAFAAREVFVSTLGLVYGIGDANEESDSLRAKIHGERRADGRQVYTPLTGLSLMVFFALACQCMSTLAVLKRETRSWRWPAFLFVYMTALAYLCSLIVYQGGKLLGFG